MLATATEAWKSLKVKFSAKYVDVPMARILERGITLVQE